MTNTTAPKHSLPIYTSILSHKKRNEEEEEEMLNFSNVADDTSARSSSERLFRALEIATIYYSSRLLMVHN
jgi:hypothetical protein